MQILEAYCVELEDVLTIYDAQKAYFAQPEGERHRFHFGCSDIDCRRIMSPLISGINYHRLAEEGDKYRQVHYRAPDGHPHLETCVWVVGDAARRATGGLADPDGDGTPRVPRAKKTNVIDIFRPKTSDDTIKRPTVGGAADPIQPGGGEPHGPGAPKDKDLEREGYSSTNSLERFINCWSLMDIDELKAHEVVIAGRKLSYRQAVSRPEWISPADNGTRIVQGGATAKFWPEDAPKRLYVNFMSDCAKFDEHEGMRSLTIDLPLSRVRAYKGGALLLEKIKQAQCTDHYLRVYCWGTIKARDQRPGYIMEIASLDNLVFKAIPKKKDH